MTGSAKVSCSDEQHNLISDTLNAGQTRYPIRGMNSTKKRTFV